MLDNRYPLPYIGSGPRADLGLVYSSYGSTGLNSRWLSDWYSVLAGSALPKLYDTWAIRVPWLKSMAAADTGGKAGTLPSGSIARYAQYTSRRPTGTTRLMIV